jgi:hypothetical protein
MNLNYYILKGFLSYILFNMNFISFSLFKNILFYRSCPFKDNIVRVKLKLKQ